MTIGVQVKHRVTIELINVLTTLINKMTMEIVQDVPSCGIQVVEIADAAHQATLKVHKVDGKSNKLERELVLLQPYQFTMEIT